MREHRGEESTKIQCAPAWSPDRSFGAPRARSSCVSRAPRGRPAGSAAAAPPALRWPSLRRRQCKQDAQLSRWAGFTSERELCELSLQWAEPNGARVTYRGAAGCTCVSSCCARALQVGVYVAKEKHNGFDVLTKNRTNSTRRGATQRVVWTAVNALSQLSTTISFSRRCTIGDSHVKSARLQFITLFHSRLEAVAPRGPPLPLQGPLKSLIRTRWQLLCAPHKVDSSPPAGCGQQ